MNNPSKLSARQSDALAQIVMEFIEELSPDDVFSLEALGIWAEDNGYKKEDESKEQD